MLVASRRRALIGLGSYTHQIGFVKATFYLDGITTLTQFPFLPLEGHIKLLIRLNYFSVANLFMTSGPGLNIPTLTF